MAEDDLLSEMTFEEEPQAAETPEVQPQTEAAPEPAKVEAKPETHVPLAALQEVRNENRTLKAQLARLDQIEARLQAQPQPVPDLYENPAAFQQAIIDQVRMAEANTIAEISERMARDRNGDDLVDAALQAAQAAGTVNQFKGKRDPWGELVKWHKAQTALSEIGDDPAAYKARVRQELMQELQAERAQSVQIPAAPSLAGQPNLGTRLAPVWQGPTPLEDILGGRS